MEWKECFYFTWPSYCVFCHWREVSYHNLYRALSISVSHFCIQLLLFSLFCFSSITPEIKKKCVALNECDSKFRLTDLWNITCRSDNNGAQGRFRRTGKIHLAVYFLNEGTFSANAEVAALETDAASVLEQGGEVPIIRQSMPWLVPSSFSFVMKVFFYTETDTYIETRVKTRDPRFPAKSQ